MITKLDIMLDPDTFDGEYSGTVDKVVFTDTSVQFMVDFDFNGKPEKVLAEVSLVKGLNRTTAMLRENGVKRIDELKSVKRLTFKIERGWINITGFGDSVASNGGGESGSADTSRFIN